MKPMRVVVPTEILRRAESLLALADPLEERLAQARGQVDPLRASAAQITGNKHA